MTTHQCIAAALLVALASDAAAQRAPEFTESAHIPPLQTYWRWAGNQVAIDGDWVLVRAVREGVEGDYDQGAAFVYRRSDAANWALVSQLTPWEQIDEWSDPGMAMKGGIAVVGPGRYVYERVGDQWVRKTAEGPQPGSYFQGTDLEISGNRMLSSVRWTGFMWERGTDGQWRQSATLPGEGHVGGDNAVSASLDLSGNGAIIGNPYTDFPEDAPLIPMARTFRYANGRWNLDGDLGNDSNESQFSSYVAMRGNHAFVTGDTWRGAHVYLRNAPAQWSRIDRLDTVDSFNNLHDGLEQGDGLVLQRALNRERGAHVINVFRPAASGGYYHAATLTRRDGGSLGEYFDISGRRIIVGSPSRGSNGFGFNDDTFIFELPEVFPSLKNSSQDSFEAGNAGSQWSPIAGSRFEVATVNGKRVYRQTSVAGEAASFTPMLGVLGDQAIQAEITPRRFDGHDRWVGLATRQSDMDNYYYVTLRAGTHRLELKRKVNGTFHTLATTSLNVSPDRTYRVRLESVGPKHSVYVNDQRVLLAVDTSLAQGLPGVIMYKAAADFDNVIVSPSHFAAIRRTDFTASPYEFLPGWTSTGRGSWTNTESQAFLRQTNNAVEARALTGSVVDDQIVTTAVRMRAFNTGSSWAGVLARYVDDSNYAYAILRSDGKLSLRQLVNGRIDVLAEAAIPAVQLDRWYRLRLEMVAGATRVFLDDVERLAVGNVGAPRGRVGVMTNRAAADFDDFLAYRP
jgi:hypothetical protein